MYRNIYWIPIIGIAVVYDKIIQFIYMIFVLVFDFSVFCGCQARVSCSLVVAPVHCLVVILVSLYFSDLFWVKEKSQQGEKKQQTEGSIRTMPDFVRARVDDRPKKQQSRKTENRKTAKFPLSVWLENRFCYKYESQVSKHREFPAISALG